MAMGLFEQLSWLTTRVKRLCCAVEQIQQSGAGSYKVYSALLSQVSSGATPTVIQELENNFDGVTFTWSRTGNGTFLCVASESIFKTDKCIGFAYSGGDDEASYQGALVKPPSAFTVIPENECIVVIPSGFDYNILIRLEIRVYP